MVVIWVYQSLLPGSPSSTAGFPASPDVTARDYACAPSGLPGALWCEVALPVSLQDSAVPHSVGPGRSPWSPVAIVFPVGYRLPALAPPSTPSPLLLVVVRGP